MTSSQAALRRWIERSITSAVTFLVSCQQEDGGFPVTRWNSDGTSVPEDRLFGTACILLAMGELLPSASRRAALTLLQRRRDSNGFWHFDAADDLPADADDTACALAVLMRFAPAQERPTLADVDRLAAFVRHDGSIATWLATDSLARPDTDDVVVVANVIYTMALCNVSRAQHWLTQWLATCAPNDDTRLGSDRTQCAAMGVSSDRVQPTTPYYMHIETVMYAWTRTLRALGFPRPTLAIKNTIFNSSLRCALALSTVDALCNDMASFLLEAQHSSGYWEAEPWFRSPGASFGSAALTTALAVEALNRQQGIKNN